MLKPLDQPPAQLEWSADRLRDLDDVRVARPQRARGGSLVVDGWTATTWLEGFHEPRWGEIIAVGDRLHRAWRQFAEPAFLAAAEDPWAVASRVAWDELPVAPYTRHEPVRVLADAREPLVARRQLIHSDLSGNVVFADPLPPAVLDFSPQWRPPEYASAIVVADALLWADADPSAVELLAHIPDARQFLIRALLFRAVVDVIARAERGAERPYGSEFERILRVIL